MGDTVPERATFYNQTRFPGEGLEPQTSYITFNIQFDLPASWAGGVSFADTGAGKGGIVFKCQDIDSKSFFSYNFIESDARIYFFFHCFKPFTFYFEFCLCVRGKVYAIVNTGT